MTHVDPVDPAGGNDNPPAVKRCAPAKKWIFRWSNYPTDWKSLLDPRIQGIKGSRYGVGEEICPTTGTPHLQGWAEFGKKIRPLSLGLPHFHWEKMKGTVQDSIEYCSKDGKYHSNVKVQRPNPEIEIFGWQCEVDDWLATEPDNRSIGWVWSTRGGRGKSSFVRHLVQKREALVCSGKAADMKFMIVKYHESRGVYPELIVFDVPRSSFKYLSYTGVEEIKNGVFASTKYECSMVEMPYPHVLVLCNFEPDMNNEDMSSDRYKVWNVDPDHIPSFMMGIPGCHSA